MRFASLRKLFAKRKPAATSSRPRARFRPSFEALEDRAVPAVLHVAPTGADVGLGSEQAPYRDIQYAINQAHNGDTILVAGGTYTYNPALDVSLQSLYITAVATVLHKQLTILGGYSATNWVASDPVSNPTVIDGGGSVRGVLVVSVGPATSLHMEGFTIQNSVARGNANPNVSNDERTFAFGGGMFVDNATAVLRNINYVNDAAVGDSTTSGHGGAGSGGGLTVRNTPAGGQVLLDHLTFTRNLAQGGTGPVRGGYGIGGGLFATDGANVLATNLTVTNNRAAAGSTPGIGNSTSSLANSATDPNQFFDGFGGGVAVGKGSLVTLQTITVMGNQAVGGDAPNGNAGGGFGGGLFAEGTLGQSATMTVRDADVENNIAQGGNGLDNDALVTPAGLAEGGGVMSYNVNVTLDRVDLLNNIARGGNGAFYQGPAGGGGVAFIREAGASTTAILNSVIANNSSLMGGGVNNAAGGGGAGIFLKGTNTSITQSTIAGNQITPTGDFGNAMQGQALVVLNFDSPTPSTVTVSYSIIANHQNNLGSAAVHVQANNSITFVHDLFANNSKDTNVDGLPHPLGEPAVHGTYTGLESVLHAADAGFANPAAGDYRLLPSSPAVDQGVGSSDTVDMSGRPRVNTPDLGAMEFAPPSDSQNFVAGLYQDVLSRPADKAGQDFFGQPLDAAVLALLQGVAGDFVTSPEARTNLIKGFYTTYLGRGAGDGEAAFWVSALQAGATPEQIQTIFVSSPAYYQAAGGTNAGWLDRAYQDVLGRPRDAGSQMFLDALNNGGMSLQQVAGTLLASDEYRGKLVSAAYTTYLGRSAGAGDLAYWKAILAQPPQAAGKPSADEQLVTGVLSSGEDYQKAGSSVSGWVTNVYAGLLRRSPDAPGFNFTMNRILNGFAAQRQTTAATVATSQEYHARLIANYYSQFLGRQAGPGDLGYWQSQFGLGLTDEQVITGIVSSNEYFFKAGNSNAGFLDKLYQDLLHRPRGANETFFQQVLDGHFATRDQVIAVLLGTTEYRQAVVSDLYTKYLGRTAGANDSAFWVQVLGAGVRDEQVLALILASAEYYQKPHMGS